MSRAEQVKGFFGRNRKAVITTFVGVLTAAVAEGLNHAEYGKKFAQLLSEFAENNPVIAQVGFAMMAAKLSADFGFAFYGKFCKTPETNVRSDHERSPLNKI